ncbi:ADP,ATP carrier protein 1, mitochondrial [Capsicum baccatum]|uniref:ADP,ATP carrier protein 1, mitochondrial n=1 Tax=Capsicum baccatum TaxID=33114 RepID=A0A2G2VIQ7_CAPBA|nr:ADP,ATP carrier protein 1, mitochondrial [Capsicum baccatum]
MTLHDLLARIHNYPPLELMKKESSDLQNDDAKAAKKGGERQFNGMLDIYRKTLLMDFLDCTVDLTFHVLVSLSTVVCTSGCAGADILRAIAGADVLAGYDKLRTIISGKKYGSGAA